MLMKLTTEVKPWQQQSIDSIPGPWEKRPTGNTTKKCSFLKTKLAIT